MRARGPNEDLARALMHEIEHVRRGDWATQCLARAACSFYWFIRSYGSRDSNWRSRPSVRRRRGDRRIGRDSVRRPTRGACRATDDRETSTAARHGQPVRPGGACDGGPRRASSAWPGRRDRGDGGVRHRRRARLDDFAAADRRGRAADTGRDPAAAIRRRVDQEVHGSDVPQGPARGTAGGTNATVSPGRFYVPCVSTEQLIYLAYAAYGVGPDEHLANDESGGASNTTKVRGGPDWVHSRGEAYRSRPPRPARPTGWC